MYLCWVPCEVPVASLFKEYAPLFCWGTTLPEGISHSADVLGWGMSADCESVSPLFQRIISHLLGVFLRLLWTLALPQSWNLLLTEGALGETGRRVRLHPFHRWDRYTVGGGCCTGSQTVVNVGNWQEPNQAGAVWFLPSPWFLPEAPSLTWGQGALRPSIAEVILIEVVWSFCLFHFLLLEVHTICFPVSTEFFWDYWLVPRSLRILCMYWMLGTLPYLATVSLGAL